MSQQTKMAKLFLSLTTILLLLLRLDLKPAIAANQLPDTTSRTGLYIVNYGDPRSYDPVFLADNFDITIESTGQAKQVHEKNPNVVTLHYREMGRQDTTSWHFDNWQEVNKEEEMFLHSTDPASMSFVPASGQLTIYWQPDKRNTFSKLEDNSFTLAGYNLYRSTRPDTGFSKLNSNPLNSTSYTDTGLTNDTTYYYKVKSADTAGKEYNFSQVRNSQPTASPASLMLANATVSASTDSDGLTTFNFSVLTKGDPTSVKLYIDLNNTWRHTFVDAGEILSMNNAGDNIYNYSLSLRLPDKWKPKASHEYKSGYAFYIQAQTGGGENITNTIKIPSSGNYATNMNNRLMNPAYEGYMTDPGNAQWKNLYLSYVKKGLAYGYDGLFIDSASTPEYYTTGGISDAIPENFNPAIFRNDVKNFISFMKQGLSSSPVTYNGLGGTSDYLEVSDAGMDEEFICSLWFPPKKCFPEDGWKTKMNEIFKADNMGRGAFLLSHAKESDIQARVFSFASYLIGKGKKSYFYLVGERYTRPYFYPEWRVSLGKPLESFSNVDNYKRQHGAYERRFEKGTVFVNPGDKAISIALGKIYEKVEVSGGLVPELKGSDGKQGNGKLSLTSVSSLSLAAHSGAIVLTQGSKAPQAKTISSPVITKVTPTTVSLVNLKKGATAKITITGKNFAAGATVKVNNIKATTVTVKSVTSIEAVILLTSLKPSQATVTVTNPDKGTVTLNKAITLKGKKPTLTSAAPKTLTAKKTGVGFLTLKGTNFLTGAKVLLDGKTTVTKTQVLSASRIKITINLSLIKKGKTYSLMLINPDGQKATLSKAFSGK